MNPTLADAREHRARCYQRWLRGDAYTSELDAWDRATFALEARERAPTTVTLTVLGDPDGYGRHLFLVEWADTPVLPMPARYERANGRTVRDDVARVTAELQARGHTVTVIPVRRLD